MWQHETRSTPGRFLDMLHVESSRDRRRESTKKRKRARARAHIYIHKQTHCSQGDDGGKGENRDQNQPSKKKHEASDVLPTDCWRCCSYDQFYNKRVASFHTRKAIDTSQIYLTHILMIDNIDTYVLKERRWNLILLNTKKMFSFVSFSNWEKRERERERRYVHKDMQLDNKQHLVRTQPLSLYNISTEQSLRACPLTRLTDKHKAQVSLKRHDSNIKEISYRPL